MTKIRHETVHYTAAEMAAKEKADEEAAAKRFKTRLIVAGIFLAVVILMCSACMFLPILFPMS